MTKQQKHKYISPIKVNPSLKYTQYIWIVQNHLISIRWLLSVILSLLKHPHNSDSAASTGKFVLVSKKKKKVFPYHSIHRQELVASLQTTMAICYTTRNDAGYIYGRILFSASHHIKPQSFISLGKLYNSWVGMALTCSKGSYCCLNITRW